MWLKLFKSILNLLCGSTAPDQPQEHPLEQPHKPQWQQPTSKPYSPSHHGGHQDANQINQSNGHYVSLRAQANEHGDQMANAFRESHEAYERGDRALAKELSNQGKEHQRKMEQLNGQASDYIFIGPSFIFLLSRTAVE